MKKVAVSIHAIENFNPNIIKGLIELDYIHVDVMDGKFVATNTNNLEVFRVLKENYDIPLIAHLMVKNPISYIEKIINFIDIFVFHYESDGDKDKIIQKVINLKKQVGIAINPETPLPKILPYLNKINLILVMSVYPGKSGQEFMWEILDKVNVLFAYRIENNLEFLIDVDGGINSDNALYINSDILSSASAILNAEKPNLVIKALKHSDKQ